MFRWASKSKEQAEGAVAWPGPAGRPAPLTSPGLLAGAHRGSHSWALQRSPAHAFFWGGELDFLVTTRVCFSALSEFTSPVLVWKGPILLLHLIPDCFPPEVALTLTETKNSNRSLRRTTDSAFPPSCGPSSKEQRGAPGHRAELQHERPRSLGDEWPLLRAVLLEQAIVPLPGSQRPVSS